VDCEVLFEDQLLVAFPKDGIELPSHITADQIDGDKLLLLEDGHCLRDHALAACNRPELRAQATMLGTSLHTLVQMVDNGLGVTMLPEMALESGILKNTNIVARPLEGNNTAREIALIWRKNSPREKDFRLLADLLRKAAR
jgi:LysR family transcriptional regulator, hydrogen peroxide-inducible genes activator